MALSHELVISRRNGASTVTKTITVTGTAESAINIDADLSIGTNQAVACAFAFAKLQYLWICSTVAMTLEFNDSSTGVPTITLVPGEPWVWEKRLEALMPNPFSENVDSLFVTNAAAGNLKIDGLVDAT